MATSSEPQLKTDLDHISKKVSEVLNDQPKTIEMIIDSKFEHHWFPYQKEDERTSQERKEVADDSIDLTDAKHIWKQVWKLTQESYVGKTVKYADGELKLTNVYNPGAESAEFILAMQSVWDTAQTLDGLSFSNTIENNVYPDWTSDQISGTENALTFYDVDGNQFGISVNGRIAIARVEADTTITEIIFDTKDTYPQYKKIEVAEASLQNLIGTKLGYEQQLN